MLFKSERSKLLKISTTYERSIITKAKSINWKRMGRKKNINANKTKKFKNENLLFLSTPLDRRTECVTNSILDDFPTIWAHKVCLLLRHHSRVNFFVCYFFHFFLFFIFCLFFLWKRMCTCGDCVWDVWFCSFSLTCMDEMLKPSDICRQTQECAADRWLSVVAEACE